LGAFVLRFFVSVFAPRRLCLVADGSHTIRKAAATILRDIRFSVAEAESHEEFLSQYRRRRPDAVLVDSALAARDSFSVLKELTGTGGTGSPKIILCTHDRNPSHIVQAISAGAHDYLIKPFDRTILMTKFERLGLTG
jgi:two-component system chemotaxis response regulator CheY